MDHFLESERFFTIVILFTFVQVLQIASHRFPSINQQVAQLLRDELSRGAWSDTMPGRNQLTEQLGVSGRTVEIALQQLEKEGLIEGQGAGRKRRILTKITPKTTQQLRVAIFLPSRLDRNDDFLIQLRYLIEEAGHIPFYPEKSMSDFSMDTAAIARYVKSSPADIWVIVAGSRGLLEWFSSQEKPVFALFGRRRGVAIASAGPDKTHATIASTRRLIELGHQRITLLCRKARRLPQPGKIEQTFLHELTTAGLPVGSFNLPDWEENKDGFNTMLASLFEHTPPTALVVDEPFLYNAAFYFVARRGLRVPHDLSMICTDSHPAFAWCEPSVAHINWDNRPVIRRVIRWINNIQQGRLDKRQTLTKAKFIEGGTIGPVQRSTSQKLKIPSSP